jgi:hypothetical protein
MGPPLGFSPHLMKGRRRVVWLQVPLEILQVDVLARIETKQFGQRRILSHHVFVDKFVIFGVIIHVGGDLSTGHQCVSGNTQKITHFVGNRNRLQVERGA